MSEQSTLDILLKWFDNNSIKWKKDCLSIKEKNGSFGVYASKNISKSETVVKIPKESILSTKTCGISNILDEADLEGGCPLALAVLYEIAQKENSPWYGYLQGLPERGEDLPMFWEEEEKVWFKGTSMEAPVYNDLDDIKDDYNGLIKPLLKKHSYVFKRGGTDDEDPYSFEKFVKVSTLVSSRAFEVDAFHEKALVPFADLFNHCGIKEHVHFETEFEVCGACGALEYCEHQYFEEEEESSEHKDNGEELDDPMEESEDSEDDMDTELLDLDELEKRNVDFWNTEEEKEKKDYCDMVLDRDIEKGEEVFNTYGDLTSAELLSKYGFCFENNQNDEIAISEDSISEYCIAFTAKRLKSKYPKASDKELEQMAIEKIKGRYEFFLKNEKILFPENEQEDIHPNFDNDCCNGDDHDHEHEHREEREESSDEDENIEEEGSEEESENGEHSHDANGGCCGGQEGPYRLYSISSKGFFEDRAVYLLHIMFVDEETFEKFTENIDVALQYFDELAKPSDKKRRTPNQVMLHVYKACFALADIKRAGYFENNNEWKPIQKEIEDREQ
ncbi:hypothetical protein CU098_001348, partial [Rhizopus stolonifer]